MPFWISKIINDTNQMWLTQQATLPIRPFGKIHVFCNFTVIFVIVYFCLMMWFSKLYVSWACFKNYKEVLELCQSTNMVSFLTKHTNANYRHFSKISALVLWLITSHTSIGENLWESRSFNKLFVLAGYYPCSPWKVDQTPGIYIGSPTL